MFLYIISNALVEHVMCTTKAGVCKHLREPRIEEHRCDTLTVEWLGVDAAPVKFSTRTAKASIPGVLELAYEPINGFGGNPPELKNTRQRIALGGKLKVGQSSVCRFNNFGLEWDSSGGNVFWGRYTHTHESRN
jgi:hypothetical protein